MIPPVTDEKNAPLIAHLLAMCRQMEREFTLHELIARALNERPEMVLDFAQAWHELVRTDKVRVLRYGRPSTYVLNEG